MGCKGSEMWEPFDLGFRSRSHRAYSNRINHIFGGLFNRMAMPAVGLT